MGPLTRPAAGFTLIEILVVLAIIAIAGVAALLAFDGNDRERASREAQRFAGALEHAAARAQVRAETLGVSAEGNGWRFWRRDEGGRWQPIGEDDVLGAHTLPEPLRLAATSYSGRAIDAGVIVPLRPTGRNEPFTFELAMRDGSFVLAADPLNRVSVLVQ